MLKFLPMFVPKEIVDKLNQPDVVEGLKKAFDALSIVRKASVDTQNFTITAWVVEPTKGRRAVCIRIEEEK